MSPSDPESPGPEWYHRSPNQSQDSKSSPDPLSIQYDLASPHEESQRSKQAIRRSQKVEPRGNDLDYNQLRGQHSLFIDPAPDEPQFQLPLLNEPQLCIEKGYSGAKNESSCVPLPVETTSEGDNQTKFQALISWPDNIQSVENIHAEGFSFSANNLRPFTDRKPQGHLSDKRIHRNTASSQPMHPSQGKASPGVVSHRQLQDGNKDDISGHQYQAQPGERNLAVSTDIPQASSLSVPNQSKCAPSKEDEADFSGLNLPDPAHPSTDNKLASKNESRQVACPRYLSNLDPQIDNCQVETKRARLEVARNSKVSARSPCQIEHQGSNSKPEDPREVAVKMKQHDYRAIGRLSKGVASAFLGKDQVPLKESLSRADSYHSPQTKSSVSGATKHCSVLEQEASTKKTGIPSPSTQCPHSTGEQRISGLTKTQHQSQASFHDHPVPETDLGQAPTGRSDSCSIKSHKQIPDAIPDLTFTHSANNTNIPPQEPPIGSTRSRIDEKDHGTGRDIVQRRLEQGHSLQNNKTEQHAKRGRSSNDLTQSQQRTATVSRPMRPVPKTMMEDAYHRDHHLHSSPPNKAKWRDHPHKVVKHRKKNTTPITPGLAAGLSTIAEGWNGFYEKFVGYEKQMMSKLHALKKQIASQDMKIAGLRDELNDREQEVVSSKETIGAQEAQIRVLMAEKEATDAQAQKMERQLTNSNTKAEALREKCQQMKARFNEGLAEQQKFYVKNRDHCDRVLSAVQQEKQAREQTVGDASRACEETRLSFQRRLEAVKGKACKQTALLEEDISALRSQLEARQRELDQENENTNRLRKELDEARNMNADTTQTLVEQNEKILQLMEAHQTETRAACHSNDNQDQKLEEIAKALQGVESRVSNPSSLLEEMKSRDENLMATVVAEIGQLMPSHPFTASDKEKWAMEIDSIHKACDSIWNQIRDDITAEETQLRYYDAQWRLGDMAEELARVQSELNDAMQWSSEKVEENDRLSVEAEILRGQVEDLQKTVRTLHNASQEANQISNGQAELLEAKLEALQRKKDGAKQASDQEMQRLKKALKEKEKSVTFTEEKWATADEKRKIAEERLEALKATFQQKESRLNSEYRAHKEGLEESKRRHEDAIRKELEESVEAKAGLQASLEDARAKIRRMSSGRQTTDAEFQKLQKLVGDGEKTANELKAEIQESQKTQMFLKECLIEWTRDRNKLENLKMWEAKATKNAEEAAETNVLYLSSFKTAITEPLNVRDPDRRVTLRSPQEDDPKATTPLSVMQERDARRQFDPPKSIMRVTRQTSKRLEGKKQTGAAEALHIPPNADTDRPFDNDEEPAQNQIGASALPRRRALSTYSSYNRPVEGNAPRASSAQTAEKKRSMVHRNSGTGLEGAISGQGEAKRPKIGGKTSCSAPKPTPETDDTRMAEVDSETTEENDQTRAASHDAANRSGNGQK